VPGQRNAQAVLFNISRYFPVDHPPLPMASGPSSEGVCRVTHPEVNQLVRFVVLHLQMGQLAKANTKHVCNYSRRWGGRSLLDHPHATKSPFSRTGKRSGCVSWIPEPNSMSALKGTESDVACGTIRGCDPFFRIGQVNIRHSDLETTGETKPSDRKRPAHPAALTTSHLPTIPQTSGTSWCGEVC